jgi:serine/threonine protein kinase
MSNEISMWKRFPQLRQLGAGSFGTVYLSKDMLPSSEYFEDYVAVKCVPLQGISENEARLAMSEIAILRNLDHPHVLKFIDCFIDEDNILCSVTEFVDGGDLAGVIRSAKLSKKVVDSFVVVDIVRQTLEGLAYLHAQAIIHRDIKPANVYITSNGIVKIGDFGVAKLVSEMAPHAVTFIGTPFYVCPELCLGEKYSFGADIWALGIMTYELYCGKLPFSASNVLALVNIILEGKYDRMALRNRVLPPAQAEELRASMGDDYLMRSSGLGSLVATLVESMLVQDPDHRPTAQTLLAEYFGVSTEAPDEARLMMNAARRSRQSSVSNSAALRESFSTSVPTEISEETVLGVHGTGSIPVSGKSTLRSSKVGVIDSIKVSNPLLASQLVAGELAGAEESVSVDYRDDFEGNEEAEEAAVEGNVFVANARALSSLTIAASDDDGPLLIIDRSRTAAPFAPGDVAVSVGEIEREPLRNSREEARSQAQLSVSLLSSTGNTQQDLSPVKLLSGSRSSAFPGPSDTSAPNPADAQLPQLASVPCQMGWAVGTELEHNSAKLEQLIREKALLYHRKRHAKWKVQREDEPAVAKQCHERKTRTAPGSISPPAQAVGSNLPSSCSFGEFVPEYATRMRLQKPEGEHSTPEMPSLLVGNKALMETIKALAAAYVHASAVKEDPPSGSYLQRLGFEPNPVRFEDDDDDDDQPLTVQLNIRRERKVFPIKGLKGHSPLKRLAKKIKKILWEFSCECVAGLGEGDVYDMKVDRLQLTYLDTAGDAIELLRPSDWKYVVAHHCQNRPGQTLEITCGL